ncbi:hypothetical protein [Spiroplasma endosymbiont of Virgichneumon dumeticola]|uniref:hypothetical protein n=1 Tax=Spiroplasma endosymbiont of Virgichneumon dumeticola TaxID=3139323 RepID=UPI0035C92EC0
MYLWKENLEYKKTYLNNITEFSPHVLVGRSPFDIYNKIQIYFLKENVSPNFNENNDEYNNIETREGFNTEVINTSDSWHCQSSTHEYNAVVM